MKAARKTSQQDDLPFVGVDQVAEFMGVQLQDQVQRVAGTVSHFGTDEDVAVNVGIGKVSGVYVFVCFVSPSSEANEAVAEKVFTVETHH